jgi:hypothetical protein
MKPDNNSDVGMTEGDFLPEGMSYAERRRPPTSAHPATAQATAPRLAPDWEVKGFQDAIAGVSQRPSWVIEDLLCSQSATLVSAQPHAMKSLSLLYACLEAVVMGRVWGRFPAPDVKSALFIETEDPAWMVETRIRGFAEGLGIRKDDEVPGFHYACVVPFDLIKEESRLLDLLDKHNPQFMVLSTLQNLLVGRDWNRQEDMQLLP